MKNKIFKYKKSKNKKYYTIILVTFIFFFFFTYPSFADEDIVELYAPHFKIYFDKNLNAPMLTSETSGDPIFDFAAQVRSTLVNAYEKYEKFPGSSSNGFNMPEDNDVYIDDWGATKTAEWDWFSKNIEIPLTYSSLKQLQHDAAHELFHAVQNQYINFISMNSYRWWMEATADYAAAYIGTNNSLINKLDLDYLKKPLNSSDEQHMYQTANFIKYLSDKGINFKDLFEITMNSSGSVLSAIKNHLSSTGDSLGDYYNDFAVDFLLASANINRKKGSNDKLVDYKGKYYYSRRSVSREISLDKNCTTNISAFEIEKEDDKEFNIFISALQPTVGIKVHYIVSSTEDPKNIVKQGELKAGAKSAVKLMIKDGYHVYFIVSNADSKPGSVTVALQSPDGNYTFRKKRKVKVYNGTFNLNIDFKLTSSYEFKIVSERTMMQNGELYHVELKFLEKIPDGEYANIIASVKLADLSFVDKRKKVPFISEKYWYADKKVPGESIKLKYSSDPNQSSKRLMYSVVIKYKNIGGDQEFWGGGANLISIMVR